MVTKPQSLTPPVPGPVCANCGAPLYGEYCYACGQPVKGLIRHLSGVLGDVLDTVLNIDSRVIRTLPALYLRPGFLSREYFAGRRVRYVTPFRLMFFLALLAFFVMQLAVNSSFSSFASDGRVKVEVQKFADAQTPDQVKTQERQALDKLDKALANPQLPSVARGGLEVARDEVRSAAAKRLVELKHSAAPAAPGTVAAPVPTDNSTAAASGSDDGDLDLPDVKGWSAARHPLHVNWWPDSANAWLNTVAQRTYDNFALAFRGGDSTARRAAWQHIITGMFSVLPQTMFVLLPLFALILKVFYLFRRRLYMEHLIVALHSHAFIFLSILVFFALGALRGVSQSAWLTTPTSLAIAAAWTWLFVYLWLMQKRVYGQGWFFTTVKYCCVGICYTVLLSFALTIALLLSLTQA